MHIAEGMLPPLHCAAWLAASTPFVVHGARAVLTTVREHPERKLILAAAGAFTLVVSALKLPSITGSSSHPTGTGLGAVLLRPPVMAFLGTLVLLFQATLLAISQITRRTVRQIGQTDGVQPEFSPLQRFTFRTTECRGFQ